MKHAILRTYTSDTEFEDEVLNVENDFWLEPPKIDENQSWLTPSDLKDEYWRLRYSRRDGRPGHYNTTPIVAPILSNTAAVNGSYYTIPANLNTTYMGEYILINTSTTTTRVI